MEEEGEFILNNNSLIHRITECFALEGIFNVLFQFTVYQFCQARRQNRGKDWKMQSFERPNFKFYMGVLYVERNSYTMRKNSERLLSTCLGQKA